MSRKGWSAADAPSMVGKTAVVTGANSGVGLATARHLAVLGARVMLACRNVDAATTARDDILGAAPGAQLELITLDLADLASVRKAADEIAAAAPGLDVLVNNAGVMSGRRELTADGFEMDFGTNFLGHFALTGLLLDRLDAAPAARVVTVSSNVHRAGVIDFDDLLMDRGFNPAKAYARSKLAQLIGAIELQRRLVASGRTTTMSVAAHPGSTHSGVMRNQNRLLGWLFTAPSLRPIRRTFIMDGPEGALPSLRAATDPGVLGGQYYGPSGPMGSSGPPIVVAPNAKAFDEELAVRLWDTAEDLTGVGYTL
ncbi:oxidoreductase [Gordonia sp. CPCC 205515]|uniref:oxidoreductase n=1 Tax=Gordonia sp. CPCC 205515 TaxID=3140791 RepID=UPI003AF3BC28